MNHNRFLSLCNPALKSINPYVPGKPETQLLRELNLERAQIIKLNSNESLWGPTPKLCSDLGGMLADMCYYPDGDGYELKSQLAAYHGVSRQQITLGNGSNDILEMIAKAFLTCDTNAVYAQYAFIVYELATKAQGATCRVVAATDYAHDLVAMVAACDADTRLLFIANPNNPTGSYLATEALLEQLRQVPSDTIIVLDQAYQDYIEEDKAVDFARWLQELDNLIICRTFAKIHALAALRIGYALSHPHIANLLNRIRQPFNTNTLAQKAAIISLQDSNYIEQVAQQTQQAKQQLAKDLLQLGLWFMPAYGNFICCQLPNCAQTIEQLAQRGIMVRPLANYGLADFARISVGKPAHNRQLVNALADIMHC